MRTAPALFILLVAIPPVLHAQPVEDGTFRKPDLVELVRLDSTVRLDIRYATTDNFMGRPMYAEARAFLQRPPAEVEVAWCRDDPALRAEIAELVRSTGR